MIRTALRLSTIAALTNGGCEPLPTMAGAHVFDSRIDPIDDLLAEMRVPVIVVRTDEDRRDKQSETPKTRAIDLRIEISVLTAAKDADGQWMVGQPATDSELEAVLDLMEFQAINALMGYGPWALWWRDTWSWNQEVSVPMWTEPKDGRVRLAIRELTFNMVNVPGECLPKARREDDPEVPAALPAFLIEVFDRIATQGCGDVQATAAQLRTLLEAQHLPAQPAYPPLSRVHMHWMEPPENTPSGEDQHVEIEQHIELPPDE